MMSNCQCCYFLQIADWDILKVLEQINFLTTDLLQLFEILVPMMAHIFLIHILKFGVLKLGTINDEIIKNVSNN